MKRISLYCSFCWEFGPDNTNLDFYHLLRILKKLNIWERVDCQSNEIKDVNSLPPVITGLNYMIPDFM